MVIFGSAEIRVEKSEKLSILKKKLQKFALNLWSRMMMRGEGTLYIMDSFDLKTNEEDIMSKNHIAPEILYKAPAPAEPSNPIV